MTVSVLGVTSYLRGCKNGGCNGVPVRDTNLTLALPLALTLNQEACLLDITLPLPLPLTQEACLLDILFSAAGTVFGGR